MGDVRESDVLAAIEELERDEIDDLVDAQMRREPSGYDHNINQPACIHCGDDAHSVPITEQMRRMRTLFQRTIQYYEDGPRASDELIAQLDAYRYDQDDSPVVCPGSEFVGAPRPPSWILERNRRATERERQITDYLSGDPSFERLRPAVESGRFFGSLETLGCFYAGLPLPELEGAESEWVTVPFGPFARTPALSASFRDINAAFRVLGEQVQSALAPMREFVSSFQFPTEMQFPRSGWTLADVANLQQSVRDQRARPRRPSLAEWVSKLHTLSMRLMEQIYRVDSPVVLMSDDLPSLRSVMGMQIRQIPTSAGYVAYGYEASIQGMASAMSEYIILERAGAEPVLIAPRMFMERAARSDFRFTEPVRFSLDDSAPIIPAPMFRTFSELRNMRVQEVPISCIYVGLPVEVPSAADIAGEIQRQQPFMRSTATDILSAFGVSASVVGVDDDVRGLPVTDVFEDESFTDPPPTNRRQRRSHHESREPMWARTFNRRGRQ